MISIRATCPLCDEVVDVPARDMILHVTSAATDADSRYGFFCPDCDVFVVRHAGPNVVTMLLDGDVPLATGPQAPWEAADLPGMVLVEAPVTRSDVADQPVFTEQDVARFAAQLTDDTLAAWLAMP